MAKRRGVRKLYKLLGHKGDKGVSPAFRREIKAHWAAFRASYPEHERDRLGRLKLTLAADRRILIKAAQGFLDIEGNAEKYWPPSFGLSRKEIIVLLAELFCDTNWNLGRGRQGKGQAEDGDEDLDEETLDATSDNGTNMSNDPSDRPPRAGEGSTSESRAQSTPRRSAATAGAGTSVTSPQATRSTDAYDFPGSPAKEVRQTSHRPAQPLGHKRPAQSSGDESHRSKQQKPNETPSTPSRANTATRFDVLPEHHEQQRRSLRVPAPLTPPLTSTSTSPLASRGGELQEIPQTAQAPVATMFVTPQAEPKAKESPSKAQDSDQSRQAAAPPSPAQVVVEYHITVVRSRTPMLHIVRWIPEGEFGSMSLAELRAEARLQGAGLPLGGMVVRFTVPDALRVDQNVPAGREDVFDHAKEDFEKNVKGLKVLRKFKETGVLRVDVEIEGMDTWRAFTRKGSDEEAE